MDLDPLASLAESSRSLLSQVRPAAPHPLERNLGQLAAESRKLREHIERPDPEGRYFMAQLGVDADRMARKIDDINITDAVEPADLLDETDVDGYLRNQQEVIILAAIEEGRHETQRAFERAVLGAMEREWAATRARLIQELGYAGLAPDARAREPLGAGLVAVPSLASREPEVPTTMPLQMHARMMAHASNVEQLNKERLAGRPFSLAGAACKTAARLDGDVGTSAMAECWDMLLQIIAGVRAALKPRTNDQPMPMLHELYEAQQPRVFQAIAAASRQCLEKQFLLYVDKRLETGSGARGAVGGVPDVENKIRAFAKRSLERLKEEDRRRIERSGDDPVWATLYFLVRAGLYDHAKRLLRGAYREYVGSTDAMFASALEAFVDSPDRTVPGEHGKAIAHQYPQLIAGRRADLFKIALYKIVGRCDLSTKSVAEVVQSTEDYLWLNLHLVRDAGGASEYTLRNLQELLVNYGPAHFNGRGANPLRYLHVLLLSGQFERAIKYMSTFEDIQVDAVHMMLALLHEGLLHVADASVVQPDILSPERGARFELQKLDVVHVVHRYTRAFVGSNPDKVFHYFVALATDAVVDSARGMLRQSAKTFVRELALETRQFGRLFGEVLPDGTVSKGSIVELFAPLLGEGDTFRKTIIKETAQLAERGGRLDDAMLLYNLADCPDDVVHVLNRRLGERLLTFSEHDKTEARNVLAFFDRMRVTLRADGRRTCETLLQIMDAITASRESRHDEALRLLAGTDVLPLQDQPLETWRTRFEMLDDAIKSHIGELLLLAETALFQRFQQASRLGSVQQRDHELARVRRLSKNLLTFTGNLGVRLSPDVYGRVFQLDAAIAP